MKVSIAMATYNGAEYIREQLDSFVVQTRLPDELIVCDDGSSDETVEILHSFAKLAPFDVRVECNPKNLGYAQNFSKVLTLCAGDLVFLSDQDDVWFPNKIETIAKVAEDDVFNQVFMNDAELTYEDLRSTGLTKLGQFRTAGVLKKNFVMGCCAAIKGKFLSDALPVPEGYGAHDGWIIKLAEGLGKRRIIEETLQYYRRHGNNESTFAANSTKKINELNYILRQIISRANGEGINKLEQLSSELDFMMRRLEQMRASEGREYVTIAEINKYLSVLVYTREATRMRLEVLRKPRVWRIFLIIRMFIFGQYKYFHGAKSALGDIFFN